MEQKSQASQCQSLQRVYCDIEGKIRRRNAELSDVNNDWRSAAMRKLTERNPTQRALFEDALNSLTSEKQRLTRELILLDDRLNDIHNDYNLKNCTALTGSLG